MRINREQLHVIVIPEDNANQQLAFGFIEHHAVNDRLIQVMPPANGWPGVLKKFSEVYLPLLQAYPHAHVVMLVDFDEKVDQRKSNFENHIPDDVRDRVFVIGSRSEPEKLKKKLKLGFAKIGDELAENCHSDGYVLWSHQELAHNESELQRLIASVKPFLFRSN